jgi:3-oxoacyl-[acyl-carrier-protein] synthase III
MSDIQLPINGNLIKPLKPIGIAGIGIYYPDGIDKSDLVLIQDAVDESSLRDVMQKSYLRIKLANGAEFNGTYNQVIQDIHAQPALYQNANVTNISLPREVLEKVCGKYDWRHLVAGYDPYRKFRGANLTSDNLPEVLMGLPPENLPQDFIRKELSDLIAERLGTKTIHFVPDGQDLVDLMVCSYSQLAHNLNGIGISNHIAQVVYSFVTEFDHYANVQGEFLKRSGLENKSTLAIHDGCAGFINLQKLVAFFAPYLHGDEMVLGNTGDTLTPDLGPDFKNRALFSDGATSTAFLPCEEGYGILGVYQVNLPHLRDSAIEDKHTGGFVMDGPKIAEAIKVYYPLMINHAIQEFGFDRTKVKIISHQMNGVIISKLHDYINSAKPGGAPDVLSSQIINTVPEYGNNASSTIPTALYDCLLNDTIREGDEIIMLAAGAGFNIGYSVMRVNKELVEYGKVLRREEQYRS